MRASPLLLLALAAAPLHAQMVEAVHGNIIYRSGCGAVPRPLTTSGRDSEPRISVDGEQVVFVRSGGSPDADGDASIWITRTDGGGPRRLVRPRPDTTPERNLEALRRPVLSIDGKRVFFLSSAWATSDAVHVADVATGAERYLIPGNSLDVLSAGRYAGHLMVNQHRYFLGGGSYDWTWLLTPDGSEVGPVGETEAAVEEFRAEAGGSRAPACRRETIRADGEPHRNDCGGEGENSGIADASGLSLKQKHVAFVTAS